MCYNNKIEDFLDRLQRVINDAGNIMILVEDLEEAFPELKERKDEKVRKALLEMVHDSNGLRADYNIYKEEAIAWLEKQGWQNTNPDVPTREVILSIWDLGNEWKELTNGSISTEHGTQLNYIQKHWHESEYYLKEKQGEQKLTDVKPRFKVGDWIILDNNHNSLYQIEKIENYRYFLRHFLGGAMPLNFCNENDIKLWTIKDAKAGDVLQLGEVTAIFKKYIGDEQCICYCSYCKDGRFEIPIADGDDNNYGCHNAHPATKEQRDLLFQKMKEAGYNLNKEEE